MALVPNEDYLTKKLIENVHSTFTRLEAALKSRETQLLRQIDVIMQQYKHRSGNVKGFNKIHVVFDNEVDILKVVSNFGIIDFEGISFEDNIYKIEEYENPNCDHICMHKCLKKNQSVPDVIPSPSKTEPSTEITESNTPVNFGTAESDSKIKTSLTNINTDTSEKLVKTSPQMIVKNLRLYASTLKTLQSYENLHKIENLSPIHIINSDFDVKALVSPSSSECSFTDVPNSINTTKSSPNSEHNSTSTSFESYDTGTSESDINFNNANQQNSPKIENENIDTSLQNASFEFHETMQESFEKIQTKHTYNRHDSRYAKISESSLAEYTESETPDNGNFEMKTLGADSVRNAELVEKFDVNVNALISASDGGGVNVDNVKEVIVSNSKEQIVNKISMSHPEQVQQWMQQIISEPETEPIHNNELLEHVNISTL